MRTTLVSVLLLIVTASTAAAQFEVARLLPHDGQQGDSFGFSASIDGDTAVVGAPDADGLGPTTGAAYVFRLVNGNWIEEAKLVPSDPTVDTTFGYSVSVSGSRVIVGAPRANGVVPSTGAAYVYRRTGSFPFSTWSEQAKLIAGDGLTDQFFGNSVSISGNRAAVGAPYNAMQGVYTYLTVSGAWIFDTKLYVGGPISGFGISVSMDADRLLIGSPMNSPNGDAHVFARTGGGWMLESTLSPLVGQQSQNHMFGWSVSLSGAIAVVSGGYYDHSPTVQHSGAAFVFERQGTLWSGPSILEPVAPQANNVFGERVATNGVQCFGNKARLAVGAMVDGVRAFDESTGTWESLGLLAPKLSAPNQGFGACVACSGDVVIIGCPSGSQAAGSSGSALVFSLFPPATLTYCTAKVNSLGCTPSMSALGTASASSGPSFIVGAQSVVSNSNGLLFFGVTGQASFPFQGGTLCVLPPIRRTPIQDSGGNVGASDCSGTYTLDFNAVIQGGTFPDLVAGVLVDCQYWSRDPASPSTTGLTNAVEFGIGF